MISPPLDPKLALPKVLLTNDHGQARPLAALIHDDNVVTLLIPGFTTCHGVCPVLTRLYKHLLDDPTLKAEGKQVSVVFFSFEPNDSIEQLGHFRAHAEIPPQWTIAKASKEDTQALLSALQYRVMKTEGGYEHPAQAFVFNNRGQWMGSLYGGDVKASELKELLGRARFSTQHPTLSSLTMHLQSPNTLALVGGGGLVLGMAAVLWFGTRLRK